MEKKIIRSCKWTLVLVIFFMGLSLPGFCQIIRPTQIEIKGTIYIDSSNTQGALIRVIADRAMVKMFYAGQKISINTTVKELPVRLSIIATPLGKATITLANFWVETSDSFSITGTYVHKDSTFFHPQNELNDFELELMNTPKNEDKLRLYAANSHHEAGLYHLWINRFNYKLSEFDYILRRATLTAKAYSAYRLLKTFTEVKTLPKQNANIPWKSFNVAGHNQQSFSIPAQDKAYTLVYLQIPGIQKLNSHTEVLNQANKLYSNQMQLYTIVYPTLYAPLAFFSPSTLQSQYAGPQPWPNLFDFTGESLLYFRVKLNMPLSNGFAYGLADKKGNASAWYGRSLISIQETMSYSTMNLPDQRSLQKAMNNYSQTSNANQPEFLLFSQDGMLLGNWRGNQYKKILTDLKSIID